MIIAAILSFVFTVSIVTFCIVFFLHRKRCHQYWHRAGIPGPKPDFFTGNVKSFNGKMIHRQLKAWTKSYGNNYGYYEGSVPVLVTTDPDIIQEVMIKKFNHFPSRKDLPLIPDTDTFEDSNMFIASNGKWRRLRNMCSPSFSAAKLKQMKPLMDASIDTLLMLLQEKANGDEAFDIFQYVQSLTLDVIAETAFGVHSDVQTRSDDKFLINAKRFFGEIDRIFKGPSLLCVCSVLMPELKKAWCGIHYGLDAFRERGDQCLNFYAEKCINNRLKTQEYRPDILQVMLERVNNKDLSWDQLNSADYKQISVKELVSTTVMLLSAGFETTSTSIAYALYLLAIYPDVQDRLREEIDSLAGDEEYPSYEKIMQMKYLDMVLHEVLRLYPVASLVIARKCSESCVIGHGIPMLKDAVVQVDLWSLHRDPQLWGPENPSEFCPDRFLPERVKDRHPMAWMPFGTGPKNCIGMRFALLEAKMALVAILKRFIILRTKETQHPIMVKETVTIVPSEGVMIKLETR